MNNKHLLVKSITLLYRESQLKRSSAGVVDIVRRAAGHVKLPDVTLGFDQDREVLSNLMKTTHQLCDEVLFHELSLPELMQQLKVDCAEDNTLFSAVSAGIEYDMEEADIKLICSSLTRSLKGFLRDEESKAILKQYSDQVLFKPDTIEDLSKHLLSMNNALEPYYTGSLGEDPAVVASFNLNDSNQVDSVFQRVKEREEGAGGIRFGFQDINKMFGGNIPPGKFMLLGALQHQHKTGFSLALFRQAVMYNVPHITEWEDEDVPTGEANQTALEDPRTLDGAELIRVVEAPSAEDTASEGSEAVAPTLEMESIADVTDKAHEMDLLSAAMATGDPFNGRKPKRKPCMLRISTEDEIEDNLEQMYRNIYFNVEKKAADVGNVTPQLMRAYVQKHLSVNGWHVHFMRVNPTMWSYHDIQQAVVDLENQGYDVRLVMVDYLMMIPTTGCEQGATGNDRRDQVRRVRAWMSAKGIIFITPWQLSPDAVKLLRTGVEDFVKHLPDRNFYSGASQISQEADIELFIHIEKVDGKAWLTCQRGKFRSPRVIPDKDKYCALPFHPEGGLQDDLFGPRLGRSVIGGGDASSGESEYPHWV